MTEYKNYDKKFYSDQEVSSFRSAQNLLPLINELIRPKSVVDVGCGIGAWLKVWQEEIGVTEYFGVDAPFILKEMLIVPQEKVVLQDLSKPLNLGRRFDIAMSLEVAEHIAPSEANVFVDNLIELSDCIIFSAAIPGQEGTFHINEQWPEYWADLFATRGYVVVDCFRKRIWDDKKINYWYRQNILVYVKNEKLSSYPQFNQFLNCTDPNFLTRIHPDLVSYKDEMIKKLNTPLGYLKLKWYYFKSSFKKSI